MNKVPCRYVIVRFLPFSETGEFVNVGIVLAAPGAGRLLFRLERQRTARVTRFFDAISAQQVRCTLALFGEELRHVAGQASGGGPAAVQAAFDALLVPREGVMRLSAERVVLASDPEAALTQLFERYVHRDFVTPELVEARMAQALRAFVRTVPTPHPFRADTVGDAALHAHFPLVQTIGDRQVKAIKPLNLAWTQPDRIYEHGGRWAGKLARMRRKSLLPEAVLLPLQAPPEAATACRAAYEEIRDELEQAALQTAAFEDQARIRAFVEAA